jgi:kynurenine formamidase
VRVVDISGSIYTGMWSYCPEYPGAVVEPLPQPAFLQGKYQVFCQKFILGGQSGTYIETEAHVDASATPVADLPLHEFMMEAVIIRVGEKGPLEPVTLDDILADTPDIREGDGVLLSCGWDKKWRDPDFVSHSPYISKEAAQFLLEHKIKLLGADFPRFDNVNAMEFPWDLLWDKAKFVLAPLTNLYDLDVTRATLMAFPLKIDGAVATPCRAALILGDHIRE